MLSVKCQVVNILAFVCYTVSVTTTQLCFFGVKAPVDRMVLSSIKLYLQTQAAAWIWSKGCIFLTPSLECSVPSKKGTFSNFMLGVCDIYEADFALQSLKFYFRFNFWWEE